MFKISRVMPALLMATTILAAPACAARATIYGSQRDTRDFERRAYDNGYRQGLDNGERDARDRRNFRIDRDRAYRDQDDRRSNDRDLFRRFFSDGYRAGYTEGFNRVARNERRSSGYPGDARGTASPAARVGYRDGFDAGRSDVSDRENYDPHRSKQYREGDHDFDSRWGSRDQYKARVSRCLRSGVRSRLPRESTLMRFLVVDPSSKNLRKSDFT